MASATISPMPPMLSSSLEGLARPRSLAAATHRGDKGLGRAIGARQEPRSGFAHMPDAERIDEPVERDAAARIDGVEQIAGAGLAPAFALLERRLQVAVALLEGENIGRR